MFKLHDGKAMNISDHPATRYMCPFYLMEMELVAHYHMKYEFQQKRQVQRVEVFLYAASFISCNLLQPLSHKHHCFYLSGAIYQSSINIDA